MKKPVFHITKQGKADLESELKQLIAERPAITERIATARAFGDLKENEEYSSARNEQKVAESRIAQIEEILKHATIITQSKSATIDLGSTVKINLNDKEQTFTLVGPVEANPEAGKISNASPIGKALLGKKVNETFTLPNGKVGQIISVE